MAHEFCADDQAPIVRECPACMDKVIARARQYEKELAQLRVALHQVMALDTPEGACWRVARAALGVGG